MFSFHFLFVSFKVAAFTQTSEANMLLSDATPSKLLHEQNTNTVLYITIPVASITATRALWGGNTITLAPLYKYIQRQTESIHRMANQHVTGAYQEQEEKEEDTKV